MLSRDFPGTGYSIRGEVFYRVHPWLVVLKKVVPGHLSHHAGSPIASYLPFNWHNPISVVILDNASIHHVQEVKT